MSTFSPIHEATALLDSAVSGEIVAHLHASASRCAARRRGDLEALLRYSFWRSLHQLCIPAACAGSIRLQVSRLGDSAHRSAPLGSAALLVARLGYSAPPGRGSAAEWRTAERRNGSAARQLGSARLGGTAAQRHGGSAARRHSSVRRHSVARRLSTARRLDGVCLDSARHAAAPVCCAASIAVASRLLSLLAAPPCRAFAAAYALRTTDGVGIAVRVAASAVDNRPPRHALEHTETGACVTALGCGSQVG